MPRDLLARNAPRRTLAWIRLASLAETEIVFPRLSSLLRGGEVKLDRDGLTNRKERTQKYVHTRNVERQRILGKV